MEKPLRATGQMKARKAGEYFCEEGHHSSLGKQVSELLPRSRHGVLAGQESLKHQRLGGGEKRESCKSRKATEEEEDDDMDQAGPGLVPAVAKLGETLNTSGWQAPLTPVPHRGRSTFGTTT